ncbi:hypothetical protein, partial [Defluviitalea phaphyphila]|uniref:hypothetical protein n=1 Tax=Defluviitalea phaphyphila TaxID=1473580 RepID=UPI0013654F56
KEKEEETKKEEQIPKEEPKENTSSELTQEQFDLLRSYVQNDEKQRQDLIDDYGKDNIPKFINIAKNYMESIYNFDYRMDFETYFSRIIPYTVDDYAERIWFKREYESLAEHKFIIEVKFLTDEYFVYHDGGPEVIGLFLFRIKSAEGNFREDWFGEYDYELGKWYQVPYEVYIGTGLKGEAFKTYYADGFKHIGPVMPVEGD